MFDLLSIFSRGSSIVERLPALVVSRGTSLLKFFVSFRIQTYKRHNYISFSSLIEYIFFTIQMVIYHLEAGEEGCVSPAALPLQSSTASPPVPGIRLASTVFLWHVPDLRSNGRSPLAHEEEKVLGQSKVEFQRMMASLAPERGLFP